MAVLFVGSRFGPLGGWVALVLVAAAAPSGCGGSDPLQLCGQIPEGGCPIGRGGTCDDRVCRALYDCVEGSWTVVTKCAANGGGGAGGAAEGGAGSGGCTPVALDHTGETTGCTPDLQVPDCPAAAAEECATSACLTDCIDFFLCKDAGWTLVAFCDDQGTLVVSGR